jgi:hypothetical protein
VVVLAVTRSGIPRWLVHRTLDDIPVVAPAGTDYDIVFGNELKHICREADIKLADNCKKNEKAFEGQTSGTVLGVGFDSEQLLWYLSEEKSDKIVNNIVDAVSKGFLSKKEMQTTMGIVNNLSMMAPFLKFFRSRGNLAFADMQNDDSVCYLDNTMKADLLVCARVARDDRYKLPIACRPCAPPLGVWEFYSDAAGSKFAMHYGRRVALNDPDDRGVASVLFKNGEPCWYSVLRWPLEFLDNACDNRGHFYGSKTTLLEAIGVLLPLLCMPAEMRGRHVVCYVDNMAVVYG